MSSDGSDENCYGGNGTYSTCKLLKIRDIRYGAELAERAGSAFFVGLLLVLSAPFFACRIHLFFYSSVCQKLGFKMIYELSRQRVGLTIKSYRYVGYCLVRPYRYCLAEIVAVVVISACHPCLYGLSTVDAPLFKISYSQIVFIINQKFLQTGFRKVC